ncbi:hypothetical protein Hanom_Chr12g01168561 [Helianthus anomalus]
MVSIAKTRSIQIESDVTYGSNQSTQTIERPDLANLFLKFLMILMCTSLFGVFN